MSDSQRRPELDALRGLMLVLMALTHLPTNLATPLGQPFGFVSAAEGFVLLSAAMAGLVYGRLALRKGEPAMQEALWRRAWLVFRCHIGMLAFTFTVVAAFALLEQQRAVIDLMDFYFDKPGTALWSALLLIYKPPLLDILPMYLLFMFASPAVLAWGLKRGWALPVAVSLLLWLGAQFGLTRHLYEAFVALVDLPVSYKESGSFDLLAWQLLWLAGLGLGARAARGESPLPQLPGWVLGAAFAVAVPLFLWRHAVGQQPFPGLPGDAVSNLVFDKWTLGPVRMLDTLALTVLLLRYGPTWAARLPRMRFLEVLGAASLRVFCGHLVIVLLMLAFLGQANPERPLWLDLGLLAASFAALYALARVPSVNPLDLWHRAAPAPPPSVEGRSGSASSTRHSRLC